MRAISWNVNSLRTRLERTVGVLERHQPDLLCLQETKVQDADFPHAAMEELGYQAAVHGQKTYNGVALISKKPLEDVRNGFDGDPAPEQARVISCVLDGVRWINVYVINGKQLGTDKFALKMEWMTALRTWMEKEFSPDDPLVILGDFNIAPEERDVHEPDLWRNKIHFSADEHAQLKGFTDWGLQDLYRKHHQDAGLFSWWDYRGGAFPRDLGLRIDLALGTPAALDRCTAASMDREERKKGDWESKPSDHIPVIVDLD